MRVPSRRRRVTIRRSRVFVTVFVKSNESYWGRDLCLVGLIFLALLNLFFLLFLLHRPENHPLPQPPLLLLDLPPLLFVLGSDVPVQRKPGKELRGLGGPPRAPWRRCGRRLGDEGLAVALLGRLGVLHPLRRAGLLGGGLEAPRTAFLSRSLLRAGGGRRRGPNLEAGAGIEVQGRGRSGRLLLDFLFLLSVFSSPFVVVVHRLVQVVPKVL